MKRKINADPETPRVPDEGKKEKPGPGRRRLTEEEKQERIKYPLSMYLKEKIDFQDYSGKKGFPSLAEFLRVAARYYIKKNP